jgi:hypothetical protein
MTTYYKMKPKWKKLWIAALRSGKYGQTQGNLASPGLKKMCCLGVLCDIVAPYDWAGVSTKSTFVGKRKRVRRHRDTWAIPGQMVESKVMLSGILPAGSLSYMNDNGVSFDEIADWIEVNL